MKYQIPKGLNDLLPSTLNSGQAWQKIEEWQALEKRLKEAAILYGYHEIRTPIFEKTELFTRTSGDSSDIVFKEMYTFIDKGERSMTLRPEGTAPVMRSVIESGALHESPIQKLYYIGPFFRYDRPQAGRYRQFHQFGVETLGVEGAELDVEVIDLFYFILSSIGVKDVTLLINTIGTEQCRKDYCAALKAFLDPYKEQLSEDSQKRLEANALRILDSKDPQDKAIIENAPKLSSFLDETSSAHFKRVLSLLDLLNIPYRVDPKLVRGLDYYNHTVFEFVSTSLSAQNTIGGGGRYDGLCQTLGGANIASVGFSIGIERLLQIMIDQGISLSVPKGPNLLIIPMGKESLEACMRLAHATRKKGISTELYLKGGKLNKALSYSDKIKPAFRIVIGENEVNSSIVLLKNLNSKEEEETTFDNLVAKILASS